MGRAPCCSKVGLHRGPWTAREDTLLINYIQAHGEGLWRSLPKKAGLLRCGKSCRLRWKNYLRPDIKRGNITPDEDDLIIRLHSLLGNRWSLIAKRLPGRTDNEIKNYWNSHLSKRVKSSETINPNTSKEASTRSSRNKAKKAAEDKQKIINEDKQENSSNASKGLTIKVHQPKASRVSPYSVISRGSSFDSLISGSSSSSGQGNCKVANNDATEVFDFSRYWSDLPGAANQEFPIGFDATAFLDAGPAVDSTNTLDAIFEEYEKLLKGDEHGESDFIFNSLSLI